MKIAFPTGRGGLDDIVVSVFGRAPTFTIVNVENKEIVDTKIINNTASQYARGAGIQTASLLSNEGVSVVIAPAIGPNSYGILNEAGMKIYRGSGKVRELVNEYIEGKLNSIQPTGFGRGFGRGLGRGLGRGFGRGFGRWQQ